MPGVTELLDNAIERGETFESAGAGKASASDLTHYVLELRQEALDVKFLDNDADFYSDSVVAAALFRIWTTE